jgi:uncharacterized RDD family membrane protein YckC
LDKKPEEFALEYAGFWIRFGAGIIDLFILLAVPYSICLTVYKFSGFTIQAVHINISIIATCFVLWFLLIIAYFAGFWVWRGQTPGKMATGIKVIRTDSSPVAVQSALLRYLGYLVSTVTVFAGFIWIAFDSRKQGLHDKIADTYVVKLPVRQVILKESYAGSRVS